MALNVQLAHVKNCYNYLKKVLQLKLYVSFIVFNPCVHDIYM
jgi:hypothetical protein